MPPVAALIAGISLTAVLESVAISLVTSLVIGGLEMLVAGGGKTPPSGVQSQTPTLKQPLVSWRAIYGRARVGGAWVYIHTTGNPVIGQNSALMGAIVLACHQCDAIEKIYLGDEEVPFDSGGNAWGKYRNYLHIWKHLGQPGQAADPWLIQWSDGLWTSAHRLDGRCYIAIDLAYNQDLFPSMPQISAQIRGKKVVDYRDNTIKWTDNPVLCIADYLTTTDYGMGYAAADLDLNNFNTEANHCDEIVQTPGAGGGWQLPHDNFSAEKTKTWKASAKTQKTLASAFTVASETAQWNTGDRVFLSGSSLPAGVNANTDYYVIRQTDGLDYVFAQLNLNRTPVMQLATSYANATATPPVPLTITGNGSGQIWKLDNIWLTDIGSKNLATGDFVQVWPADANPLPTPLVAGTGYYWIDRGHQPIYYEINHALIGYGQGMVAATQAAAYNNQAIPLTGISPGTHGVGQYWEKRWTLNGVVDTASKPSDILTSMLAACGGKLVRQGSKWRILTAVWRGVTDTLTDADARGPIKVNALVSRRDLFNAVRGTFISPINNDQPSDFPPYPNLARPDLDIFLAEDGGERIFSNDIQLPFTRSSGMAQRLAKILLMQVRKQISVVFQAKLTAFGITAGEIIQVTNKRMGWANKTFEVVDWTFSLTGASAGSGPVPGVDLTLRESDPAIFDWSYGAETTGWWAPRTNLPQVWYVPAPVIIQVTEELKIVKTGGGRESYAHIYWQPIADAFTGYYQVGQWDAANPAAVGYQDLQTASTGTENVVGPLAPGETYCFVVRGINILNISSPWSAPVCVHILGVTTIPPDVQNFHVQPLADKALVTWALSTDADVLNGGYIELRWTSDTTNKASWLNATALDLYLAGTATEATILLKAGTYFAKQVNSGGLKSQNAVSWIILVVDKPGWNIVLQTLESPSFPGTKTSLIVSNNNLQLGSTGAGSIVDNWVNVDAVPNWDGEGGAVPTGTYAFSVIYDLGAKFGFRAELDMMASEIGNSLWGDQASATITAQIATTNDPPLTGTPTWSAWQPLLLGDFIGRGVKRQLIFNTKDPHASIACSYLHDSISMFSRTWTQAAVAIPATGLRVNYTPAFYAVPTSWGDVDNQTAGDYVQVTAQDRSGATYTIRNSGGVAKAGTADLYAVGIGQQLA